VKKGTRSLDVRGMGSETVAQTRNQNSQELEEAYEMSAA
jgi:hypothetical protein